MKGHLHLFCAQDPANLKSSKNITTAQPDKFAEPDFQKKLEEKHVSHLFKVQLNVAACRLAGMFASE